MGNAMATMKAALFDYLEVFYNQRVGIHQQAG